MAQSGFVNDQSTATEDALRRAVDSTPAFIHTARPDGYLDYFNRGWLFCALPENFPLLQPTLYLRQEQIPHFRRREGGANTMELP